MKSKIFLAALGLVAMSAAAAPAPTASQFSLGTTVLNWSGLSSSDSSSNYAGLHGEWQYTMPSGIVLNVNGIYTPGLTSTGTSSNSLSSALSHVETRVGMNMKTPGGTPFMPYISLGQHQINSSIPASASALAEKATPAASQSLTWQYAGLGVQGSYPITPSLSVGYHVKALGHLSATQATTINKSTNSVDLGSTWGYAASLPITLSSSDASTSVVIEPGMTKLDASASANMMHAKVSLKKSF